MSVDEANKTASDDALVIQLEDATTFNTLGVTASNEAKVLVTPLTNSSIVKAQLQDNAGTAIVLGQTTMSASVPVTIASNQSAIPVSGTVAATQSGAWTTGRTWTLGSGTDSVSAVQSGAWTAGRTWTLASGTDSVAVVQSGTWTVQPGNTQNTTAWLVQDTATNTSAATAATRGMQIMGVFNTTPATLTNGQSGFLQLDASQNLLVNLKTAIPAGANVIGALTQSGTWNITNISGTISLPTGASTLAEQQTQTTALQLIDNLPLNQASTTSGQQGVLIQGAVTTAAPTYVTAQTSPLSLTTAGELRITGTVTQKVPLTASAATAVSIATSTTTVVASNANRKGLTLVNLSNAKISLGLGASAVINTGVTLYPGGSWEMDNFNFTTGAVNGIASAASSVLAVQEFST